MRGSRLLSGFLLVCSVNLMLIGASAGEGYAAELTSTLPTSQTPATPSSPMTHSSDKLLTSAIDSFRLSSSVQTHHVTAPHAKDLWREVNDQRTVNMKATATFIPGLLAGEGEFSYREPTGPAQRGLDAQDDRMARMAASGTLGSIRYGLSYRSAGKDYVKEADHTTRDLWGEWRAGVATVKATVKESWNNVAGNAAVTRLRQRQEQLSLAMTQSVWPALNLSYTHAGTVSTLNPEGIAATRTGADTVDAAFSYQTPSWTAKLASTYSRGWTQSPAVSETDQFVYAFTGSYRPLTGVNIDPTITFKEDVARTTGVKTESPTGALSVKYAPSPTLTWTGAGSYGLSHSSDGLINTRAFSAKQALSWKAPLASKLTTAFSFETAFQRTTDHANADHATSDVSALCRLQIAGF